jgi:MFS family permease
MINLLKMIPRKHRVWGLLFCGTALYFFANIQRVAIPGSVFNILQEELKVSASYITALGSSFMYIYALCQLIIGLLVDRYGGSRVIAVGALLFCIGSCMFPMSNTLFMLYLSRAIVGLGASALYLSLVKEILRDFHKNFTIMLAILILVGYSGGIVANAPLVLSVNNIGWRNTMLIAAFLSIAFYLLFLLAKSSLKMPSTQSIPFSIAPFLKVLKNGHNLSVFLFTGINFGLYYVLQTVIGKKFLEDFCFMSSNRAAVILSVMGMISAGSGLSFAIFSTLLGKRRRLIFRFVGVSSVTIFSLIILFLWLEIKSDWLAVLMCLLAGTASTQAITIPLLRDTNEKEFTGVTVSLLNFGCFITVAVFGNAVGLLMNLFKPEQHGNFLIYGTNSYLAVFGTMLLFSTIVAWCSFQLRGNE